MIKNLFLRRINAWLDWLLIPNVRKYVYCLRCRVSALNPFVEFHSTPYQRGENCISGCFPLCEDCWNNLTPIQRLPYYKKMWDRWVSLEGIEYVLTREPWEDIKKAVLEGK